MEGALGGHRPLGSFFVETEGGDAFHFGLFSVDTDKPCGLGREGGVFGVLDDFPSSKSGDGHVEWCILQIATKGSAGNFQFHARLRRHPGEEALDSAFGMEGEVIAQEVGLGEDGEVPGFPFTGKEVGIAVAILPEDEGGGVAALLATEFPEAGVVGGFLRGKVPD